VTIFKFGLYFLWIFQVYMLLIAIKIMMIDSKMHF